MLRTFVTAIGVLCVLGAIGVAMAAPRVWPAGMELLIFGGVLLAGILFEQHYRGRKATAAADFQKTGERFVDPTTGKLTEVLYDPKTGERVYRD